MTGEVGILNVGAGDTKLTFDNRNPAETIRAARIVKDMLRRGYALLIEVTQPDGSKAFQRALAFHEDTCEYVIADYDPSIVSPEPERPTDEEAGQAQPGRPPEERAEAPETRKRGRPSKTVPASTTRAVAVARTAGG